MKTRDRILETGLRMFNDEGESNVSTNHIADEMDISPGNLYYHFRNKEQIVQELFDQFRHDIQTILMAPEERPMDLEDMWLFLHLVFETIWQYRFLYRNLIDLTQRYRSLRRHFDFILRQKVTAARTLCGGLQASGALQADDQELDSLADNIALIMTYWLSFSAVQSPQNTSPQISPGVYQVMALIVPFLREPERSHLKHLAHAYLD